MSNDTKLVESTNKDASTDTKKTNSKNAPKEIGGREGLEPTRYGDWEKAGRCTDF